MLICELSILQFTVWKLLLQGKKWEGGGQRCKWIYSSNHRHRENKQFQLKHFLLRWEGEEARGSSAAKHFEHLHAYCVSLSGTQQAWQRTRFLRVLWALQREASNPAKKEKKKQTIMHFIISACQPTCLFSFCPTRRDTDGKEQKAWSLRKIIYIYV